jgi:hypothetical protein
MKLVYTLFFLILLSCNTTKKEYVCGDHSCFDKKEFNEYFSKNLTIEIKSQDRKKNKSVDLVKLNTDSKNVKKNNNVNSKKKNKIRIKNKKDKIKAEKIRLLEERKIAEEAEINEVKLEKNAKLNEKNEQKIKNEISNDRNVENKIVDNANENKKPLAKTTEKTVFTDTIKSDDKKSICSEIKDCDIDKIAELLIKKGKDKPFPNISSN